MWQQVLSTFPHMAGAYHFLIWQAGCVGLKRQRSPYDDYMKWGAVANLGGCTDEGVPCTNLWYSTPHAGPSPDSSHPDVVSVHCTRGRLSVTGQSAEAIEAELRHSNLPPKPLHDDGCCRRCVVMITS